MQQKKEGVAKKTGLNNATDKMTMTDPPSLQMLMPDGVVCGMGPNDMCLGLAMLFHCLCLFLILIFRFYCECTCNLEKNLFLMFVIKFSNYKNLAGAWC